MNTYILNRPRSLSPLVSILFSACMALLVALPVQAGVVMGGTRVIYPANEKDVSLWFTNNNPQPTLVQVWLDDGNENIAPDQAKVPFLTTPPVFRMEPDKQQVVRLVYTGDSLPKNKESLFWLNVLEVPPKAQDGEQKSQLQFAFRSRLKVFFRPQGLPYGVELAPEKLVWGLIPGEQGPVLKVHNPTPYYINFESVTLVSAGKRYNKPTGEASAKNMVGPGESNEFELPTLKVMPKNGTQVEFKFIDDIGVARLHTLDVTK